MKNFDSRTYSINDFVEWSKNQQLELSPKFQRRDVWSPNARSYLMDTIVRGKPIPKIFIRQKINPSTARSVREVVDGQQRLKTILSFLRDAFMMKRIHNEENGGKYYSQLDEETQTGILNYELSVDLLVNMPDADVLDVFGRLNSYAVILNDQEKINAQHFGPFKILADSLGRDYYQFWITNKVLTESSVLRMGEVSLVADLLIAMIAGIRPKKQIHAFYDRYEDDFPHDTHELDRRFRKVMSVISDIFGTSLESSEFRRVHLFYSLFTAIVIWSLVCRAW